MVKPKTKCEYCGGVFKNAKLHLRYCDKAPLDPVTVEDVEARFEESAKKAEETKDSRVMRAMGRRSFLPLRSDRRVKFPTIAWYLRPNGALPEDAFCTTSVWAASQREDAEKRGFIEVTPSKPFLMRREDGSVIGGTVMLDMPPEARWQRILAILEARRLPALAYEKQRLEDEEKASTAGMSSPEMSAARSRVRVYSERVEALSRPFPADELLAFFEEEVRYSRRDQNRESAIRRIVDERVDELVGADVD